MATLKPKIPDVSNKVAILLRFHGGKSAVVLATKEEWERKGRDALVEQGLRDLKDVPGCDSLKEVKISQAVGVTMVGDVSHATYSEVERLNRELGREGHA